MTLTIQLQLIAAAGAAIGFLIISLGRSSRAVQIGLAVGLGSTILIGAVTLWTQ